jgi:hypothetical protein
MKNVLRLLTRLYPAWWRRRYGGELEALLEDSGSQDVWDLLRGAMEMQMKTWSFGRIVTVCGIAGVVLAGLVAFLLMPYPYQSTATLKITPLDVDAFVSITEAAFTRNALTTIVLNHKLYRRERTRMQMEGVIDRMRRAIVVRPVGPNLAQVSFSYEDPVQAQRVSQDLVARIIYANLYIRADTISPSPSDRTNGERIELVAPADEGKKQIEGKVRTAMTSLGLPAGLLFGAVLALFLRRRAPAIR